MKLISSILIIALVWLNLSDPNLVSSFSMYGSSYTNDIPRLLDRINSSSENKASEEVGALNRMIGKVKKEYYSLNSLNHGKVDQSESRISRAVKYYKQKNYKQAFMLVYEGANDGDYECYELLGLCYAFGVGTRRDFKKGKIWLKKAGYHMCYTCWGDGDLECDECEGSGRRYSFSGADIGKCLEECSYGEVDCYTCGGIGVYDPRD